MIEDKLKASERIRLEAIAQANAAMMGRLPTAEQLVEYAGRLEDYIVAGKKRGGA